MMDVSHIDGPLSIYVDDYRCMRSSNDNSLDKPMTLSSLSVVDLDPANLLNVFGLFAFENR